MSNVICIFNSTASNNTT